jgi:flagellar basal-body rod protein FlgF
VADQGLPTRVATVAATQGSDFADGPLVETGNPMHAAVQGQGWFAVQTPAGEAYTRAGEFAVNAQNMLVTAAQGYPVLSADGQPIELPDRGTVSFSSDGQISALGAGDPPNTIQQVGQLKLVKPPIDQLQRGDDGFFRVAGAAAAQPDPSVRMVSGFIEKSNVNAAKALVSLIENARQYETQMQVINSAASNAERANGILSAGN